MAETKEKMGENESNDLNLADISRGIEDLRRNLADLRVMVDITGFYKRVLTQAVLTAGGRLSVDPSLAEAAAIEKRRLWIAGGEVKLIDAP